MKDIDSKDMVLWIEIQIGIEKRSVAFYQQFPELGRDGRQESIHKWKLNHLQERLSWWRSQVV